MSRKEIFDAIRAGRGRGWPANDPEIGIIDGFLDSIGVPRDGQDPRDAAAEPAWVTFARGKIGQREVVGPNHNSWIVAAWKRLGAGWFTDDETPWCGNFIAQCMEAAGLPWPKEFARAKAWVEYGRGLDAPAVGAIGVKSRNGGGHVFLIVGETRDKRFFKALGGNQGNAVSIIDIAKADVIAIRWPPVVPLPASRVLPVLAAGMTGASEA